MNRKAVFDVCNRKNPGLEKFLAGVSEKNITRDKLYTQKEIDRILSINTPHNILPLKIYPNPHSVILVKNNFLKEGFGIFDPNAYTFRNDLGELEMEFVFMIQPKKDEDTERYTERIFNSISPLRPLNRGNDTVNPGYCGIFGIIFMAYFKNTSDLNGWDRSWVNFVNTSWKPFYPDKKSDSIALQLAAEVQLIIKNNTSYSSMEVQILEKIKQYFYKVKIPFPEKTTKRKRTDFGKQKYKYNNRLYLIHIGPRGGKYILVNKVKKYINI